MMKKIEEFEAEEEIEEEEEEEEEEVKTKVLYIEDDLDFSELTKSILTDAGFEVSTTNNATTFKTLFRKFRPDILLIDLNLEDSIQGIDIIRDINKNYPSFPIVVYSTFADASTVIETMQCGVMHHINKDRSVDEFIATLNNALRQAYRFGENFQPEYKLSEITTYNIRNSVLYINGKEILLKRIESRMLKQLCVHINEFVSPEELSKATWGIHKPHQQVHRYMSIIRLQLEPHDPSIKIVNKRGSFYKLECQDWL